MARKSKSAKSPDMVIKRLRAAHEQLRLQSDRTRRAADQLGRLITQVEAQARAAEAPQPRLPRTS